MKDSITSQAKCTRCGETIEALTLADLAQAGFDHIVRHTKTMPVSLFPYYTTYQKLSRGASIGLFLWATQSESHVPRQTT